MHYLDENIYVYFYLIEIFEYLFTYLYNSLDYLRLNNLLNFCDIIYIYFFEREEC